MFLLSATESFKMCRVNEDNNTGAGGGQHQPLAEKDAAVSGTEIIQLYVFSCLIYWLIEKG